VAKLKITYKKSAIGLCQGSKGHNRSSWFEEIRTSVVQEDNPAHSGYGPQVRHLVEVEEPRLSRGVSVRIPELKPGRGQQPPLQKGRPGNVFRLG